VVQRAGGLALILPPDETVAEMPDRALDLGDALLIRGGSDVDPASYGARPTPRRTGRASSATASSWLSRPGALERCLCPRGKKHGRAHRRVCRAH